ncbi:MAG: hypothetical protein KDK26_06180 [Roseivivax sp.]|nr:hypothetical protein [Roseivivax sp.]
MIAHDKFQSPEELDQLLGALSLRLHHLNRVAIGESTYVWWLAELLRAAGELAPLMRDEAVRSAFGDGWTRGDSLDPKAQILKMLEERMPSR